MSYRKFNSPWKIILSVLLFTVPVVNAADKNLEHIMMDDLTVLGVEGIFADADVEIAGFTTFGSTIGAPAPIIGVEPGALWLKGGIEALKYSVFGSSVTIIGGVRFPAFGIWDIAGNVGIGTTGPEVKLEISDLVPDNDFAAMYISNTDDPATSETGQAVSIVGRLLKSGSGTLEDAGRITFGKDDDFTTSTRRKGHIRFLVANQNPVEEKMRITSSGNVGIATTTPQGLLHVGSGATPGLLVTPGGNVGIGTISPAAKLEVNGNIIASLPVQPDHVVTKEYADGLRPCTADMVEVGAWCVDKYEASVWDAPTGGTQYGSGGDDYLCQDNGQDCAPGLNPIYARSELGVTPSRFLTWFQANMACANVGKELLPNHIWQIAATGTSDPGGGFAAPNCNTLNGGGPTTTGAGTGCVSSFGAEDMIGSLWEMVADWTVGAGSVTASGGGITWDGAGSSEFGDDGMYNVGGEGYTNFDAINQWWAGQVVMVSRGGSWQTAGDYGGVFAYDTWYSPSSTREDYGFRCGRRR